MNRQPIMETLGRIDLLVLEINENVPASSPALSGFRSDLAGLLNVTICAAYENCVKLVLHNYAAKQSSLFEVYAKNKYDRINSKIDIRDLHHYAKTFHPCINNIFKEKLQNYKNYYLNRTSEDIVNSYVQILNWRHDFAHTGQRVTTVEEVIKYHKIGKRVILLFSDAFCSYSPTD